MTIAKEHPTAGELARYVVQADEPDECVREVRRHLESGCEFCIVAVGRLLELAQERAGPELQPARRPRWVVPQRRNVPRPDASDSTLAGFRVTCRVGPFEIDLLARESAAPAQLRMVGQITRKDEVYAPVADLAVGLVDAGSQELGEARTDAFGEFDLVAPVHSTVGLVVGDGADAACVLIWDGEPR